MAGLTRDLDGVVRRERARVLAALVIAAASLSVGCFPSTFNVRADKAFANEPPVADVVRDRAADIEKLLDESFKDIPKAGAPGVAVEARVRGRGAGRLPCVAGHHARID